LRAARKEKRCLNAWLFVLGRYGRPRGTWVLHKTKTTS